MGVTGLWTVVQPCARPIKIETLNRKRLAVDASIWIYQFLKAVRDKEGNALRNSHVVGFFRRICKLLFFGIKAVFVFDGGAPALKRQTISGRKARREGRREDAARTAGKLLALQMQRRAEEEEQKRKEGIQRPARNQREEEAVPEDLVYVDELQMTQQERQQNRKFKKKDQYHLPDLDGSMSELAGPNDPRVMSLEDLEQYARQFNNGEDINVYDFSKIDFNSPFFMSLPASDRYNILNAARLRSRLRMGLSKEQLDTMFPDRMAFSRFQIERVTERNDLTQRLMHVSGMLDDATYNMTGGGRVAGEKGREYVLVKNDGVEGGWALGVIGDKEQGERDKPIDVDALDKRPKDDDGDEEWEEDGDGFEDVPIEGLNRLPKLATKPKVSTTEASSRNILQRRAAEYAAKKNQKSKRPAPAAAPTLAREDSNTLFVGQDINASTEGPVHAAEHETDEEDLQRAIAMSLENNDRASSPEDDDFEEVFHEHAPPPRPGTALAPTQNKQSTSTPSVPFLDESDDDTMDFAGALAESRMSKHRSRPLRRTSPMREMSPLPKPPTKPNTTDKPFDGPLPFERLDLGSSLLGRRKAKQLEEDMEGGFEKEGLVANEKKPPAPPPPWFNGDVAKDLDAQKVIEQRDRERDRERDEEEAMNFGERPKIAREAVDIVDIDAIEEKQHDVIELEESEDELNEESTQPNVFVEDTELRMGDLADMVRAEPLAAEENLPSQNSLPADKMQESDDEAYEWEASDRGDESPRGRVSGNIAEPAGGHIQPAASKSPSLVFENVEDITEATKEVVHPAESKSPSPDFENVGNLEAPPDPHPTDLDVPSGLDDEDDGPIPASGTANDQAPAEDDSDAREYYSSAEDEELMDQLALEAEEHARFASQLNQARSVRENMEEYEKELKSLRNQQKKDRRDADEVTQVMITECQQLLKLFGLPYVTAPMEAEAQCAELVHLGLVDGIVTDDSDIFLFGGTRVYKNMFNQDKFVECYLTADLEREFDLTRHKLIALANLLGSDYTEGLPGVGPVTALEIVSEFSSGLDSFREWWTRVQTGAPVTETDAGSAFRRKFRRGNATKLFLAPGFPDKRVEAAYLLPEVDHDPSEFQWGVPDLDALRSYLMATIGWSQERTDEVLVPVIKDMNRRDVEGTQANITRFFSGGVGAGAATAVEAPRKKAVGKSKRMEEALERMAAKARSERKRKVQGAVNGSGSGDDDGDVDVVVDGAGSGADTSNALAAQEGSSSQRRRQGLVGRADVIPVAPPPAARKRKTPTTDNDTGSTKKNAPKRKRAKRPAAAVAAGGAGSEDDLPDTGGGDSDDSGVKPASKKPRAKRKVKQ